MAIDKALIEDIKSSTNIVDGIGEVVSLKSSRSQLPPDFVPSIRRKTLF